MKSARVSCVIAYSLHDANEVIQVNLDSRSHDVSAW